MHQLVIVYQPRLIVIAKLILLVGVAISWVLFIPGLELFGEQSTGEKYWAHMLKGRGAILFQTRQYTLYSIDWGGHSGLAFRWAMNQEIANNYQEGVREAIDRCVVNIHTRELPALIPKWEGDIKTLMNVPYVGDPENITEWWDKLRPDFKADPEAYNRFVAYRLSVEASDELQDDFSFVGYSKKYHRKLFYKHVCIQVVIHLGFWLMVLFTFFRLWRCCRSLTKLTTTGLPHS